MASKQQYQKPTITQAERDKIHKDRDANDYHYHDCQGKCVFAIPKILSSVLMFGSAIGFVGSIIHGGGLWVQMKENVVGPFNFVIAPHLGLPKI